MEKVSVEISLLNCLNILSEFGLIDETVAKTLREGISVGDKKAFKEVSLRMWKFADVIAERVKSND